MPDVICRSCAYSQHLSQQRRRCQRKWVSQHRLYLSSVFPSYKRCRRRGGRTLLMLTVLLIILILALLGALPTWPYSHAWGYYPSGGLGILLIIVIILLLL